MMKRSIAVLLAAILVLATAFALSACGSDETKNENTNQATAAPTINTADDGVTEADTNFVYNGITIALDSSFDAAVSALGEPESIKSETSCHGEGDDKTYTYSDFTLKSYPKEGEDRVLQVLITVTGVPTSKGIEVGNSLDDVTAAYGTGYNKIGKFYSYNAGDDKQLRFAIEDNKVTQIDFFFKAPAK